MVFCVFFQVSFGPGICDSLSDIRQDFVFEMADLFTQFIITFL